MFADRTEPRLTRIELRSNRPPRSLLQGALAALIFVLGCASDASGPGSSDSSGRIGPFPAGVTGKVAFATSTHGNGHSTDAVHVVDPADRSNRVIWTGQDEGVEGLTWAPNDQELVMGTVRFSLSTGFDWKLHRVNLQGTENAVIYDATGSEHHPAYGSEGQLAYFAESGPNSPSGILGIYIDGTLVYPITSGDDNTFLAWDQGDTTLILTSDQYYGPPGLSRLSIAAGMVTPLLAPDNGEVIVQPAVSPDGARIAIMRYPGNRADEELWTVSAAGTDAQQLTKGSFDSSPAWTPDGQYIAFIRWGNRPGVYLIPSAGGQPTRVIGGQFDALAWSQ
jgi:dipeptidyl aminopeptidase/acylaminoacyl peptidase